MPKTARPGVAAQRRTLLDAAQRLIARQGIEATTVKHLLDESGVSRATFYRCFPNLERVVEVLYEEFSAHVLVRLHDSLEGAASEPSEAMLERMSGQVLEDAARFGPFLTALFREELRPGAPAAELRNARIETQVAAIRQWWTTHVHREADDDLIRALVLLLQILGLEVARGTADVATSRRTAAFFMAAVVERYLAR